LAILVADETVASFGSGFTFDVEQRAQVFKQTHLVAVVFGVVLNVPLMSAQILDNVLLLTKLKQLKCYFSLTFALKNSW
jgi:hypothetical protein